LGVSKVSQTRHRLVSGAAMALATAWSVMILIHFVAKMSKSPARLGAARLEMAAASTTRKIPQGQVDAP